MNMLDCWFSTIAVKSDLGRGEESTSAPTFVGAVKGNFFLFLVSF